MPTWIHAYRVNNRPPIALLLSFIIQNRSRLIPEHTRRYIWAQLDIKHLYTFSNSILSKHIFFEKNKINFHEDKINFGRSIFFLIVQNQFWKNKTKSLFSRKKKITAYPYSDCIARFTVCIARFINKILPFIGNKIDFMILNIEHMCFEIEIMPFKNEFIQCEFGL